MPTFADVMHLLPDKFAGRGGRAFALFDVFLRLLHCLGFWHGCLLGSGVRWGSRPDALSRARQMPSPRRRPRGRRDFAITSREKKTSLPRKGVLTLAHTLLDRFYMLRALLLVVARTVRNQQLGASIGYLTRIGGTACVQHGIGRVAPDDGEWPTKTVRELSRLLPLGRRRKRRVDDDGPSSFRTPPAGTSAPDH